MKARDIIPGWPKPRSVLVWRREWDPLYLLFGWPRANWYSRDGIIDIEGSSRQEEFAAEVEYHAGQQAMVNAHFEKWRNRPTTFGKAWTVAPDGILTNPRGITVWTMYDSKTGKPVAGIKYRLIDKDLEIIEGVGVPLCP